MEQIPMEVIDMADDFFLHSGKEQRAEILKAYSLEQPVMFDYFRHMIKLIKPNNVMPQCEYLFLIIYRSFKYYGIKFPKFGKETMQGANISTGKNIMKNCTDDSTVREIGANLKALIKQDNLMDYIHHKMFDTPEGRLVFNIHKILLDSYYEMIVMISILNNEIKKHIGNEVN